MVGIVKVKGLGNLNRFMRDLPKNIKKEIQIKAIFKIAVSGQRRIKRMYDALGYGHGRFSTGFGFKNISIKKTARGYGIFVPAYIDLLDKPIRTHWVSLETIKAHRANPGITMFKRASNVDKSRRPILFRWRGPFIDPALNNLNKDIPRILERALARAIARTSR